MRSLILLGHAEGGTSTIYRLCVRALSHGHGLDGIGQAGEVLNAQRMRTGPGDELPHHADAQDPKHYGKARAILEHHAAAAHIVKDVVNLGLAWRFLLEFPDRYKVLVIRRDPRDVLATRFKNGHRFPGDAPDSPRNPWRRHADLDRLLAELGPAAVAVDFPDVISAARNLQDALESLGYTAPAPLVSFGEPHFAELKRRQRAVDEARSKFARRIERSARRWIESLGYSAD